MIWPSDTPWLKQTKNHNFKAQSSSSCILLGMFGALLGTLSVGTALSGAGSSVGLLNNILTFVKNAEKAKETPGMSEVLARLPGEAFALSGQYVRQIQNLRTALIDAGVDLSKTQRELLQETGIWHRRRRNLLNKFSANINSVETQLSRFLDDAVAVAHCCGGDDFVVASFAEAEEMRTVLHRETDPSRSLGEILSSLEGRAQELRSALGDIEKGRGEGTTGELQA